MRRYCWLWVLGLAACVNKPPVITGGTTQEAATLTRWTAQGRIGVSAATQSGSGAFVWQQHPDSSAVSLRGPAGMGALTMTLQGETLTLKANNGSVYDADAALDELEQRLGVALPMTNLPYWLRGLAAPGQYQWLDAAHSQLEQAGWQVHYDEWQAAQRLRLPLKLTLQREAVRVVVKVQSWRIDE